MSTIITKVAVSHSERILLLVITLAICICLYGNQSAKLIDAYNKKAIKHEIEKKNLANDPNYRPINFGIFSFTHTPLWYIPYALQFLTFPLSFLILRRRTFLSLTVLTTLTAFSFSAYAFWAHDSIAFLEYLSDRPQPLLRHGVFLYESTIMELLTAVLIAGLLTIKLKILVIFVLDNFKGKIPRR